MQHDVVHIPYDTTSARAEWLRKRMDESQQAGAGVKVAVSVVLLVCAGMMLAAFAQAAAVVLGAQAATASQYFLVAQTNQIILQVALVLLSGIGIPAAWLLGTLPTHLLLSEQGIQLKAKLRTKSIDWKDIEKIECGIDDALRIYTNDRLSMSIKIPNLSQEDRLRLLDAIKLHAPLAVQEPAVIRMLTASRDQTYTEIWLQAFATPPKHESMIPLLPGAKVREGQYVIDRQLGAGGLGTAYLARTTSRQEIVLKEFILPVFVDTAVCRKALRSFEDEARLLKALDHPNIVKLFDFFVEDQRAYMALEYVDGPSLRSLVTKDAPSGLDEQAAIRYALQACAAIEHLHSLSPPVVHRDVTPDNLILNSRGQLKLIDFNVAQQETASATAIFVGKPGYLPPEQFRGEPTIQSDIYALGATLHFLLTGSEPIALSVSHPKRICSTVSRSMEEIVEKMTALDPRQRYASVAEVRAALEKIKTS